MKRRTFLKIVAAATAGVSLATEGKLQHWKNGGFGTFVWTGDNPRQVCYKGRIPDNIWEDFKKGVNFEDRSDWRAVVEEITDLPYVLDRLPKEGFVRVM